MTKSNLIQGRSAAIRIANLDTDQIMPKQFLHGIDKMGLDKGVLYDLRFDRNGMAKSDFVLNKPEYLSCNVLLGYENFGCGSSREHAVWGLQQYGIQAVIAPSFGEIFFSNAMNNGLLLVTLPANQVEVLMIDSEQPGAEMSINVEKKTIESENLLASFSITQRHQRMLLEGLDVIGLTLAQKDDIDAFAGLHWKRHPWMKDVAKKAWSHRGAAA